MRSECDVMWITKYANCEVDFAGVEGCAALDVTTESSVLEGTSSEQISQLHK